MLKGGGGGRRRACCGVVLCCLRIRQMLKLPRGVRKPLLFVLESAPALTRYAVRKTR